MSKASKLRACPALGQGISPADCGAQRLSQIACPADCAHNPFNPANYSQLLEIEDRLDAKTAQQLAALAPDRAAMQKGIEQASRQGLHATHAFFVWNLFFATDAQQRTLVQRWEQTSGQALKNDERVLLHAKMQMRVVLLEVQQILPGNLVEVVDLLAPNPVPLRVQDRSLAATVSRFSTFLAWMFPLPHYWRMSGTATAIPEIAQFSAPEIVREIVAHLGGPLTEAEMRRWLAEHFHRCDTALQAVIRTRHQQMLAGVDAKWGKAVYELQATFAQCRKRLDALADVADDELSDPEATDGFTEARVWFDAQPTGKPLVAPGGRLVLGRVLLGKTRWRLETFGAEKLARLRQQFEAQMGERMRFTGERVDDLGAQMAAKEPAADASLVPPRLLENPRQITMSASRIPALPPGLSKAEAEQALLRTADQAFLDDTVPALDHRTPRQAARDPQLRPKLIQLLKQHVRSHDERNLQTGRTDDINWLLRELELTEIDFPAPPWRPPPTPPPGADDDLPDADLFDEPVAVDPNRPLAPFLPPEPFTPDEAADRLEAAMDLFPTAAAAEAELVASGSTLLLDAEELSLADLGEKDFCFAIPFLLQAWFALMPKGCRAPAIDFAALEKSYEDNLRQLAACGQAKTQKKLERFFLACPQPGLMMVLLGGFLEAANTAPAEIRPHHDAQPIILALLKATVETLDEALRPRRS